MVGLTQKQLKALPASVTGIPRTESPEELVRLYAEADCFVNPTYEDTYPTVNMEAIACGTPVAAYAVGGCIEQLTLATGKTVPCGNVKALAEAAVSLGSLKEQCTQACSSHAQAFFNRKDAMATYMAQYSEIIGDGMKNEKRKYLEHT